MARRAFESPREMGRARVHERREVLDPDVLRDVLVYKVIHGAQL
jgi:hypothetical protein